MYRNLLCPNAALKGLNVGSPGCNEVKPGDMVKWSQKNPGRVQCDISKNIGPFQGPKTLHSIKPRVSPGATDINPLRGFKSPLRSSAKFFLGGIKNTAFHLLIKNQGRGKKINFFLAGYLSRLSLSLILNKRQLFTVRDFRA